MQKNNSNSEQVMVHSKVDGDLPMLDRVHRHAGKLKLPGNKVELVTTE